MTEKSLLDNTNSTENIEYINECVREVCINGDDLSKYEKMIGKLFPDDAGFYAKVSDFVTMCKEMANKPSLSATSMANIKYLASEIHVTDKTIDEILSSLNKHPRSNFNFGQLLDKATKIVYSYKDPSLSTEYCYNGFIEVTKSSVRVTIKQYLERTVWDKKVFTNPISNENYHKFKEQLLSQGISKKNVDRVRQQRGKDSRNFTLYNGKEKILNIDCDYELEISEGVILKAFVMLLNDEQKSAFRDHEKLFASGGSENNINPLLDKATRIVHRDTYDRYTRRIEVTEAYVSLTIYRDGKDPKVISNPISTEDYHKFKKEMMSLGISKKNVDRVRRQRGKDSSNFTLYNGQKQLLNIDCDYELNIEAHLIFGAFWNVMSDDQGHAFFNLEKLFVDPQPEPKPSPQPEPVEEEKNDYPGCIGLLGYLIMAITLYPFFGAMIVGLIGGVIGAVIGVFIDNIDYEGGGVLGMWIGGILFGILGVIMFILIVIAKYRNRNR